jgi:hypothetical protein
MALVHGLKLFRIWLCICRENIFDYHQNWIPRCQWHRRIQLFCQSSPLMVTILMWCLPIYFLFAMVSHQREWEPIILFAKDPAVPWRFRGVGETAEFDPAVAFIEAAGFDSALSFTPRDRIPRFQWHRWMASPVSLRLRNLLQKCQSRIPRCHWHRGI